jgi:uncharacterized membrane protein YeiH
VFAVSGALAAGRKSLDWLGVAVIAVVTAIGGGTVRDVLLNRHPIFWIADPSYLVACLAATVLTLVYVHLRIPAIRALFVADALGLAFFTVGGVQIAEQAGLSGLLALLMGLITGVVGGVARDVLLAEIPLILRRGHLYASAAIVGAALYLVLERAGAPRDIAALVGMATIAIVRFAAILWRLELPVLSLQEQDHQVGPDG